MQKLPLFFLISLLVLFSVLVFPPTSAGSGSFYLAILFLAASLFASSEGKGIARALAYMRLSPKKKEIPSLFIWGAVLSLLSVLLTMFLSFILLQLGVSDSGNVLEKIQSFPLPVLIMAFTLSPFAEEMLFRGYIFRKATEGITRLKLPLQSWLLGALVSSLLFSAVHFAYGSTAELVVAFGMGFLFCIFTQKTNSLVPALIAHAFYNFASISFMVFL